MLFRSLNDELALLLAGKRREFRRRELIEYLGFENLGLTPHTVQNVLENFDSVLPKWFDLLRSSFLTEDLKAAYQKILEERIRRLHY